MPRQRAHSDGQQPDRAPSRTESPAAGPLLKEAAGRARILLVEDEDPFRELLQAFLEIEGFDVRAVRDGRCGVRWLRTNSVDVVITDLCMPESDGMELLMELRKIRVKIPIIVMSGGVGGEMAGMLRAASLLGARYTLAKPFPLRQLVAAVRTVLAGLR